MNFRKESTTRERSSWRGVGRALGLAIAMAFGAAAGGQSPPPEIDWVALLPDGPGKNSVLTHCMGCHGLDRIVVQQRDQDAWFGTIGTMIGEYSAVIPESEMEPLAEYLGRVAGEDNPVTEVPMEVNSVAEAGLRRLWFLSDQDVSRILASRAKEKFQSLEQVRALVEPQTEESALLPVYLKVRPVGQ
jgi:hypothetical protein